MTTHSPRSIKLTVAFAFLASIVAANWMIQHIGTQPDPYGPHMLPVGFGLLAPSAVYIVGVTLVLRDVLQRLVGKPWTFGLILIGAALSIVVSPALALASAAAFLISELADFAVFSVLERYGFLGAALASNAVSIVADSVVFLTLAFGSLAFVEGQIIGKAWATVAGLLVLVAIRAFERKAPVPA